MFKFMRPSPGVCSGGGGDKTNCVGAGNEADAYPDSTADGSQPIADDSRSVSSGPTVTLWLPSKNPRPAEPRPADVTDVTTGGEVSVCGRVCICGCDCGCSGGCGSGCDGCDDCDGVRDCERELLLRGGDTVDCRAPVEELPLYTL